MWPGIVVWEPVWSWWIYHVSWDCGVGACVVSVNLSRELGLWCGSLCGLSESITWAGIVVWEPVWSQWIYHVSWDCGVGARVVAVNLSRELGLWCGSLCGLSEFISCVYQQLIGAVTPVSRYLTTAVTLSEGRAIKEYRRETVNGRTSPD